ncbi:hypothetical protein [Allopusillimonas ginsengisoli]|uniref:hypothetical protein n=1 Tax=Allopusillimonas ginsengisoli TaxID=453575 RepID=UPI00101EAB43|nr:hypothetical protein [Allopusillimonas ginsengisoli]TEA71849.1 hypothetical protein ERE07_20090 [Allopusillimonas ginsengisoli]
MDSNSKTVTQCIMQNACQLSGQGKAPKISVWRIAASEFHHYGALSTIMVHTLVQKNVCALYPWLWHDEREFYMLHITPETPPAGR